MNDIEFLANLLILVLSALWGFLTDVGVIK